MFFRERILIRMRICDRIVMMGGVARFIKKRSGIRAHAPWQKKKKVGKSTFSQTGADWVSQTGCEQKLLIVGSDSAETSRKWYTVS